MANVIVVAVVIVLLGFALKGTLKHLKGESPCCGGGDTITIEDKKLDGPVIGKKTVKISGMHCDHCVRAVTEAINKIDGASAKVNLKKKEAVVSEQERLLFKCRSMCEKFSVADSLYGETGVRKKWFKKTYKT